MGNSLQILFIVLLPEKVTVFSLPCKQQIFNDASLYSHLNASGTSLKSGGSTVRSLQWWWNPQGPRYTREVLEMDVIIYSSRQPFHFWGTASPRLSDGPLFSTCAIPPRGLWPCHGWARICND